MTDDDFFKEFDDIKPLSQDKHPNHRIPKKDASVEARREAAITNASTDNHLSEHLVKDISAHDIVGFKRDGVQEGVYKKLRLGKYDSDARLDLHRMSVAQARQAVFDFVLEAKEFDLRVVTIVHGKGDRDNEQRAVLKSHTVHWLEDLPDVLAFHSAQIYHGGAGALYVLLRKSEKAKMANREKHGL